MPVLFLTALFSSAQTVGNKKNGTALPTSIQLTGNPVFSSSAILKKSFEPAMSASTIITQDYYTQHYGWVCKKEFALEKITKIPLRIRLGSLQQCNYLEGKK